jgi:RNA polymerase sigma-70 factor (ECF subfamily)
MGSLPSISFDELWRHAGFVRALARQLCADAAAADDLAQDVWLRTLDTPPRTGAAPRGWLATVARHLAANLRRGDARRTARERAVPAFEASPSPAAVLASEQVRERVVRAVLALPEPFRAVLLLRFWEGLPPRAIARRLGVPGATVRTRLARGLDHLRAQLDREYGGDRAQWRLALGPFLGSMAAAPALLPMLTTKQFGALAGAIAIGACLWLVSWPTATPTPMPAGAVAAESTPTAADATAANEPAQQNAREEVAHADAPYDAASQTRVFPAVRGRGSVFGSVLDADGRYAAGVEIEARPVTGHSPPGLVITDDRGAARSVHSDADGAFRFDGLAEGPFRLRAQRGAEVAMLSAIVGASAVEGPVQLRLAAVATHGDDVRILVVDTAKQPVEGADVSVYAWSRREPDPEAAERSLRAPMFEGRTDATGRVTLTGRGVCLGIVWARIGDGRVGMARLDDTWATDPIERTIRVDASGGVDLQLQGAPPQSLAGAVLSLHALASFAAYGIGGGRSLDHVLNGDRLLVADLPAGDYAVSLAAPGASAHGVRLVAEPMPGWDEKAIPNSVVLPRVTIVAGKTTAATLAVAAGGEIRGTVVCGERPVRGARVRAVLAPRTSNFPAGFVLRGAHVWRLDSEFENAPDNPIATVVAHTDASGHYELGGLTPGAWRVEVAAPALSFDRRQDVAVTAGEGVELRHELSRAGVLQVAVRDATYLGVLRPGEAVPVMLAVIRDDFATFPGLAPGRYCVARCHSDTRVEPVVVGEGEVTAGRTTWLDLRRASVRAVITGKVLAGAHPVVGAQVLFSHGTVTDGEGSFRLELGFEPRFSDASLSVVHRNTNWTFAPTVAGPVRALDLPLQLGENALELTTSDADGAPATPECYVSWRALTGVATADSGLVPRAIDAEARVGASGRVRFGPFPAGRVDGWVRFGDLSLPLHATMPCPEPLHFVDPPRATLRVRVARDGRPLGETNVWVRTWKDRTIAAPEMPKLEDAFATAWVRTDAEGFATLAPAAGEIGVSCDGMDSAVGRRLRVEVGESASVVIDLH